MLRLARRRVLLPLALACALPAQAWAPETRVRQLDEAVRLLPASLRAALEGYRTTVLRGALEPLTSEDSLEHRPPWAGGGLDASVQREVDSLARALADPRDFDGVAAAFGRLAHFVADAGFPPGIGEGGGARYPHFAAFCESRRPRFPVVFYGHDDPLLARGAWREWALQVMERARGEDAALVRAYDAAGDPPRAEAFDDRSVPFAVGSLAYSRTITDIAAVWLAAWERAGGDVGRTPYRQQSSHTTQENAPDGNPQP